MDDIIGLIDRGLEQASLRALSPQEVTDLLLDIRSALSVPTEPFALEAV